MKRKTRRDWGPLLTAFDGKQREPLTGRSARRIPLAEALARDERIDTRNTNHTGKPNEQNAHHQR